MKNYPPFYYFVFTSAGKLQNVSIQILFFSSLLNTACLLQCTEWYYITAYDKRDVIATINQDFE